MRRAVLSTVGAGNLWVEEVQVNHSRSREVEFEYVLQFKFGKINSFFQFSRLPIVTRFHFLMLSFMMAGCGIENELCHAACISSLSSCLLLVCRVNLPRWICMCYIRTFTFLVDRSGYWFCSQNGDLTWDMCGILCSGPQPQPFMEASLGL